MERRSRLTGLEKGILGITQKTKHFFYHEGRFNYFRLILTIAILYLVYALILLGYQRVLYAMEIHKTEQYIRKMEQENQKLRSQLDYLNTSSGLEETVRQKLGYVKPGETAVQFVEPGK